MSRDADAMESWLAEDLDDPRPPSQFTCEACSCEGYEEPVLLADGLRFCAACAARCLADLAADIARDWDAAILEDAERTRALEAEEETADIPRESMQAVVNGGLR